MNHDFFSSILNPGKAMGISLGAGALRAVGLSRSGPDFHLSESASVEFPPDRPPHPSEVEAALTRVIEDMDDKTRTVANIRATDARLHFFDLPFDRPDKVREVLAYTVEPLFMGKVENLLLDYVPLTEDSGQGQPGLVFGAQAETVSLALEEMRQSGLDPAVLLPDSLGLVMAGQYLFKHDGEARYRLLVDLGAGQTSLVLYDSARPLTVRTLSYGGRDITLALAEQQGLDVNQAESIKRTINLSGGDSTPEAAILTKAWEPLFKEIERTLAAGLADSGASDRPVITLAGGGARTPGLAQFLKNKLQLDVQILGLDQTPAGKIPGLTPELVPAFGLAMLGLTPKSRPNLRQGDLAPKQIFLRHWKPLALMAGGLLLAGLFAVSNLFLNYYYQQQRYNAVKTEINLVFKEAAPEVTRVVYPLAQLRQKVNQARNKTGVGANRQRVLDLLLAVSQVTSTRPNLRLLDLSLNPQSLELQGEGGTFEDIDRIRDELSSLPYFSEVTVGGARIDQTSRKLTFKLSLKRK